MWKSRATIAILISIILASLASSHAHENTISSTPEALQTGFLFDSESHEIVQDETCVFKAKNAKQEELTWNLNGLKKYTFRTNSADKTLDYDINFFKLSSDSDCVLNSQKGSICSYSSGKFSSMLGSFFGTPAPSYSLIDSTRPETGIAVVLRNAQTPEGFNIIFAMQLFCDSNAKQTTFKVEEIDTTQNELYRAEFKSKFGCPGYFENDSSISGGWIFIIVFFSLLVLYFAIGFLVYFKVYGQRGMDAIPHKAFWASIPSYTAAGVMFTYHKLRSLCGPKSGTSYEEA